MKSPSPSLLRSLTALALAMAATAAAAAAQSGSTLSFVNGDRLRGSATSLEDGRLEWDSPSLVSPSRFDRAQLLQFTRPGASLSLPEGGDHLAVVGLTNGDTVRGVLREVGDESITLGTSFGGVMTFRRTMVASLDFRSRPEIFFTGPTGIDGWTQEEEDGWSFQDGQLVSNGPAGISRDLGRHEQIHIAFDLEWRNSNRFRLIYFGDTTDEAELEDYYELTCQSRWAYLRHRNADGGRPKPVGSTSNVDAFREKEKVRMELFHDRLTGRIRLVIDGEVVADWRDDVAIDAPPAGGALHFITDSRSPVRVSHIVVSSWDGHVEGGWEEEDEEEELLPPGGEEASDPGIRLRNGDIVRGKTLGIRDGKVRIETSFGEIDLPVSRLRSFKLRTPEEAKDPELCWEPYRYGDDVRAWFPDGGHLTFRLDGLRDGNLIGYSQTFGDGRFELAAFERIEFNIHDWKLDDIRREYSNRQSAPPPDIDEFMPQPRFRGMGQGDPFLFPGDR